MKRVISLGLALALAGSTLTRCESITKTTVIATAIGCAGGLAAGALYDELQRKQEGKDRKNDILSLWKKRKADNKGKIIGLGVGCLAGLGTGLYLDMMHDDIQQNFQNRGMTLEKVADANGETKELLVKMDGDISFETGSASLKGTAADNVAKLNQALGEYPDTGLRVWGHTDGTGSLAVNQRLSLQRAETVKAQMVNAGIDTSRIIDVQGLANSRPLPGTNPGGNVPQNRRVEIRILPKS